jgi:hypothetical protein
VGAELLDELLRLLGRDQRRTLEWSFPAKSLLGPAIGRTKV